MYIVNFVLSFTALFVGSGIYLSKLAKIKALNNIEGKDKIHKQLNNTHKLTVLMVFISMIAILYAITIVNPQPFVLEYILGAMAGLQGLRAYLEWQYEHSANRYKISLLHSNFLLFLLLLSGLRSLLF